MVGIWMTTHLLHAVKVAVDGNISIVTIARTTSLEIVEGIGITWTFTVRTAGVGWRESVS
jgi:hypothetical protein